MSESHPVDERRGDVSAAGPSQGAKTPSGGSELHEVSERGGARRKAANKSARTRSREFAVQALYQHLVGRNEATGIDSFTRDLAGFSKADSVHFDALLHGCIAEGEAADALLTPALDRPLREVSPIERAILWIGVFELRHCLDVPWRVVLNECVELAKDFGGTDGHKYVNGVLNTLAKELRADEVQQDRSPAPKNRTTPKG